MKKFLNRKAFTLAELLIVVAIIAVLVGVSIPVFSSQLEKSREASDLASVRARYAEILSLAITGETDIPEYIDFVDGNYVSSVPLKQKQSGWSTDTTNLQIGDVTYLINTENRKWIGEPSSICTISYNINNDTLTIDWGGEAVIDFVMPEYSILGNWATRVDASGNKNLYYTPYKEAERYKHAIVNSTYDVDASTKGVTFKFPSESEAEKIGLDPTFEYRVGVFIVGGDQNPDKGYKLYEDLNSPIGKWGQDLIVNPKSPDVIGDDAKAVFQFYKKDKSLTGEYAFVELTENEIKALLSLYQDPNK